jgi:hypothetical protein
MTLSLLLITKDISKIKERTVKNDLEPEKTADNEIKKSKR